MSDANPIVSVGNSIPTPPLPKIIRYQFSRIDFINEIMGVYGPGANASNITPDAPRSHFFWTIGSAFGEVGASKPDFVNDDQWSTLQDAPSGFVTAVSSVMPKLFIPSQLLVNNGVDGQDDKEAWNDDGTQGFNWTGDIDEEDFEVTGNYGSRLISVKQKKDDGDTSNTMSCKEPDPAPTGQWNPSSPLVGVGAFVIVLNVVPVVPGKATAASSDLKWGVTIKFGEVTMKIDDTGALNIEMGTGVTTRAQLSDSQAKEKPPQVSQLASKPYTLVCYPVWNGMIVSSGIQDCRNVVKVASQFCMKTQGASVNSPDYQQQGKGGTAGPFDTKNPDDVYIKVTDAVKVNFGSSLNVQADNCRYELAYLPLFFSPALIMDSFFIVQKDEVGPPSVNYSYNAYPIWTDNDAPYAMSSTLHTQNSIDEFTEWKYMKFQFKATGNMPNRRAGELFGVILRTKEEREVTTETSNGNFNLSAPGGTPAGPGGSWTSYIKTISTSVSLDGASGQIAVDKYGFAGQGATPIQSIGALTLNVSSAPSGSVAGLIFSGIGMGISDNTTSDGGDFNVPLTSLSKKLEDIVLINVPFFDGEPLGTTLKFLCDFAGITADLSAADQEYTLPASDDIQSPLIDFKTGTTVMDAINQLMELTAHNYVFQRDGKCHFYKLGTNGLPSTLGPDYSGDYPGTRMISIDRTPDFEDLRNEIFALGMRKVEISARDNLDQVDLPLFPLIVGVKNATTPDIPWSKGLVFGVPGFVTEEKLDKIANNLRSLTSLYELTGRTTIPGDSRIEPYQKWGNFIVVSVTQNVDLQNKTWTTDIEFASGS